MLSFVSFGCIDFINVFILIHSGIDHNTASGTDIYIYAVQDHRLVKSEEMIKADINKVKNLFKQLIEEVAQELLQEYKSFAQYIGLERIIRNTINDEVVEKEALKMNN